MSASEKMSVVKSPWCWERLYLQPSGIKKPTMYTQTVPQLAANHPAAKTCQGDLW